MDSDLAEIIQSLDDTTLAILSCLIASQHLIVNASSSSLASLEAEIARNASATFAFTCATITCTPSTTVDDFSEAIVVDNLSKPQDGLELDTREIANIVIARDLDLASEVVQIQALEVMRQRRVLSHTAIHAAPKHFVLVALLQTPLPDGSGEAEATAWLASEGSEEVPSEKDRGLIKHINDHFFISHAYEPSTETHELEDQDQDQDQDSLYPRSSHSSDDTASTTSVSTAAASQSSIRIRPARPPTTSPTQPDPTSLASAKPSSHPPISSATLTALSAALPSIRTTAEVRRYAHDIPTYLRLHRAVAGGISAISTRHLDTLARILALLHGIAYVTPPLVQLAARKVFAHRIVLATPATERSMQWGSDRRAVEEALRGVQSIDVLEDVLDTVPCPL